jgi:hypothetical protein
VVTRRAFCVDVYEDAGLENIHMGLLRALDFVWNILCHTCIKLIKENKLEDTVGMLLFYI